MPAPYLKLARHPAALFAAIALLGFLVLFPGLGTPGLWEPNEMAVADEAVARHDGTYAAPVPATQCPDKKPDAEGARTLTPRAAAWGLGTFATSDGGARTPLALLGFVGVLAVFGIGARLSSMRAGFLSGLVLMSFPLWALQSRQLTSELPTAVGASLLVYGMTALCRPVTSRGWAWLAFDLATAFVAIRYGAWLAFEGGGVLLGLLPPLAAVAVAGGFGLTLIGAGLGRAWRFVDRRAHRGAPPPLLEPWRQGVAIAATLATAGVSVWLAYQVFDLGPMTVGTREIGGKSILTSECWSTALGGVWKADDDLNVTYNELFEQIGFGMFPWGVLVPIALTALATGVAGERRRFAGAVALGWAAGAWFAAAVWQRKVGFVIYGGFPACAVGVGVWLDAVLERRTALSQPDAPRAPFTATAWALVGLLVVAGVLVLTKDLGSFTDKLTSLLVGKDQIKYPPNARFLFLPMKTWLWVIGMGVALPLALSAWLWRPPHRAEDGPAPFLWRSGIAGHAAHGVTIALVFTALAAMFWTHGWHRGLSENLSSKHVFQVYREVKKDKEPLAIMGSMGNAPRYYAGGNVETLQGRDQVLTYLARPDRVFALVPSTELCPLHAARTESGGLRVLDDTNAKWLLLSNQLGGARDKNPLATMMTRTPPPWLKQQGEKDYATWENQVKLVGVRMPQKVVRGETFTVTLVFKVIAPIGGSWQIFAHFDQGSSRFQGDHWPLRERCATSYWKVGDYVIDTFTVEAGNASFPGGNYDVWFGFFTGSNPSWRNMTVTAEGLGKKDAVNRVKIGQVRMVSGGGGCSASSESAAGSMLCVLVGLALVTLRSRRKQAP